MKTLIYIPFYEVKWGIQVLRKYSIDRKEGKTQHSKNITKFHNLTFKYNLNVWKYYRKYQITTLRAKRATFVKLCFYFFSIIKHFFKNLDFYPTLCSKLRNRFCRSILFTVKKAKLSLSNLRQGFVIQIDCSLHQCKYCVRI